MAPVRSDRRLRLLLAGGLVGLGLLLAGAAALVVPAQARYRRALRGEERLQARFPGPEAYTPPPGGRIPPDRMRAFLEVRRALAPHVPAIETLRRDFLAAPPAGQGRGPDWRAMGRALGGMSRASRDFNAYLEARTASLDRRGMGHGEYTWIWWAAYVGFLGERPQRVLPSSRSGDLFRERVPGQIRAMASRCGLEAGEAGALPLAEGLPEALREDLAPFRQALEATRWPSCAELDLACTVKRGVWIDHQ